MKELDYYLKNPDLYTFYIDNDMFFVQNVTDENDSESFDIGPRELVHILLGYIGVDSEEV